MFLLALASCTSPQTPTWRLDASGLRSGAGEPLTFGLLDPPVGRRFRNHPGLVPSSLVVEIAEETPSEVVEAMLADIHLNSHAHEELPSVREVNGRTLTLAILERSRPQPVPSCWLPVVVAGEQALYAVPVSMGDEPGVAAFQNTFTYAVPVQVRGDCQGEGDAIGALLEHRPERVCDATVVLVPRGTPWSTTRSWMAAFSNPAFHVGDGDPSVWIGSWLDWLHADTCVDPVSLASLATRELPVW